MVTTFSPDLQPQLGKLVVCAGTAVIDNVYRVDRFPVTGIKTRAADFRQILGGCAANASVAVHRLGGRARLASAIGGPPGRDLTGDSILARLSTEQVDVSAVMRVDGATSSLSSILIDRDGERLIVNFRHPKLDKARPTRIDRILSGADVLMVDNRYPEFVLPIAQAARERDMIVVLDGEQTAAPNEDLLLAATHIVFSAEGLRAVTRQDNLETALRSVARRTGAFVAFTDGARDMMWLETGKLRALPTFRVKAIDTLAAGDIFHGAFALALAEGQETTNAMRFAAAVSAIKCTRFGGGTGCPERAEVDEFLAAHAE
jgi:sulfofructose kinase